jgi:hypothetical protein
MIISAVCEALGGLMLGNKPAPFRYWFSRAQLRQADGSEGRKKTGEWAPAAALAAVAIVGLAMSYIRTPSETGQYVIVAPPWWTDSQVFHLVSASEGAILDVGRFHGTALAKSDNPRFAGDAAAAGALLVLPAAQFGGCFSRLALGARDAV